MNKNLKNYSLISISLIFFIFLDLISFSQTADQIKPSLFLLSFIYWNIALPEKMNLFFAFIYNGLGVPLAAGVLAGWGIGLSPMWAAGAMSLSSLSVIGNALRLNRSSI